MVKAPMVESPNSMTVRQLIETLLNYDLENEVVIQYPELDPAYNDKYISIDSHSIWYNTKIRKIVLHYI